MLEQMDPVGITLRVSIMYLYALTLARISGKQSLGQLTPMDFVVTLIIGDLFDDVFWTEVPVVEGLVAFASLIFLHMFVTLVSSRNKTIYWLLASPARVLVRDGRLVLENLQREWIRPETVQFELRLNGEEHLKEVKATKLEPSGQMSVLNADESKPLQKKDERLLR
jgi:uncharacterized membrane protein YcaP (DUF421 family)